MSFHESQCGQNCMSISEQYIPQVIAFTLACRSLTVEGSLWALQEPNSLWDQLSITMYDCPLWEVADTLLDIEPSHALSTWYSFSVSVWNDEVLFCVGTRLESCKRQWCVLGLMNRVLWYIGMMSCDRLLRRCSHILRSTTVSSQTSTECGPLVSVPAYLVNRILVCPSQKLTFSRRSRRLICPNGSSKPCPRM